MDARDYGKEFKENLEQEIRQQSEPGIKPPKAMLVCEFRWGFAWGLIIVLVGAALLLHHMGVIPYDPVARYWPLLFVVLGVMNLMSPSGRLKWLLLVVAGAFLQLNQLGITHLSFADVWPIALIVIGLLLMWGSLENRGFLRAKAKALQDFREQVTGAGGSQAMLNAVAVFGGCERRVSGPNFQGGRVTAIFGGVELDFRDADIASEAILEVNCVIGGVEIRVPETWHVHSRNLPVFGGYEDKTRHPSNPAVASPKTLIVTGMVVFGGIEIKN